MRYVLRRIAGDASSRDQALVLASRSGVVVDSAPDMLLIKATPQAATRLAAGLPGWHLARETSSRRARR